MRSQDYFFLSGVGTFQLMRRLFIVQKIWSHHQLPVISLWACIIHNCMALFTVEIIVICIEYNVHCSLRAISSVKSHVAKQN